LPPLLVQVQPFTQQLGPLVETLNRYRREVTGVLGNVAAASNPLGSGAETGGQVAHYLRTAAVLEPQSLAAFPSNRLTVNRNNAYPAPGSALDVAGGLQSFETGGCSSPPGAIATLDPSTPLNPDFAARATLGTPQQIFDAIKLYGFNDALSTAGVSAPPCVKQGPQPSIGQIPELTDYPHVYQFAP
jgi:hypothetical protein